MIFMPPGKIAVVGSGAVGLYYGGMLAHAGHDVSFLLRSDLGQVRKRGLEIRTRGERIRLTPRLAGTTTEIGPADVVLIALKATANEVLDELLPPLLHADTQLVTLQNGLGNEEYLAERWGGERVLGALCFVCLNRVAPGVVEHLDHGSISVGEFWRNGSTRADVLASALRTAGIEAQVVENLVTERWRKLLWNIPFNGLAIAAGGLTVADILASESLRTLARELMEEARLAAARLGHEIPSEFADHQISRSESMGPYRPSSLIDWQLKRPVEVEAIWGEPLRQGLAAGAPMPRLETLYALLHHLAHDHAARR